MPETLLPRIEVPFTFTRTPEPLPPDLRPAWRIAVLLLMLRFSRGNRASLKKLHVLDWALRTPQSRERFIDCVKGRGKPEDIIIRFDPGLNRGIDYARGEGLVTIVSGKNVVLTDHGSALAQQLDDTQEWLVLEREFLNEARPHVLERNIEALLGWEVLS